MMISRRQSDSLWDMRTSSHPRTTRTRQVGEPVVPNNLVAGAALDAPRVRPAGKVFFGRKLNTVRLRFQHLSLKSVLVDLQDLA